MMNTVTGNDRLAEISASIREVIDRSRKVFERVALESAEAMVSMPISSFGRKGEEKIPELKSLHGAIKLTLRGKDAAVVMDIEDYKLMLATLEDYRQIQRLEKQRALAEGASEFDALMAQITSPANRAGIDAVFQMSDTDLNACFRPGTTEATR